MFNSGGSSPRKSAFLSAKNSPRKPILSPSELTPFSFSTDSLKILASDIEKQNGIIPLSLALPSGSSPQLPRTYSSVPPSRPHTPLHHTSGALPSHPHTPLHQISYPVLPTGLSKSVEASSPISHNPLSHPMFSSSLGHTPQGGHTPFGGSTPLGGQPLLTNHATLTGGGSLGTPGKSMRDYDESFKELRKENFNLKLRIYFMEERMGLGKNQTNDSLANANVDLKVQLESCRQDLAEKNALVAEAGVALQRIEQNASEQEEQHRMEVAQLEEKVLELTFQQNPEVFQLSNTPATSRKQAWSGSPDLSRKRETVWSGSPEISRRVNNLTLDFSRINTSPDNDANLNNNGEGKGRMLDVLNEQDETSEIEEEGMNRDDEKQEEYKKQIQELQFVITNTEHCLSKIQNELKEGEATIYSLKEEISSRDVEMEKLQQDLDHCNHNIAGKERVVAELERQISSRDVEVEKLQQNLDFCNHNIEGKERVVAELEKQLQAGVKHQQEVKHLKDEIVFKNEEMKKFEAELTFRDQKIKSLQEAQENELKRFGEGGGGAKQHQDQPDGRDGWIPPEEVEKLKMDIGKLKDQLKLQVQERKLLLKKISMLNDQLTGEADHSSSQKNLACLGKGGVMEHEEPPAEEGIQCDLGHSPAIIEAYQGSVKKYRKNIVDLKKRLAESTDAYDTMRGQLEEVVDMAERVIEENTDEGQISPEYLSVMRNIIEESRTVSRNLSHTIVLGVDSCDDTEAPEASEESDASWNIDLPDITDIHLCSSPDLFDHQELSDLTALCEPSSKAPDYPTDICGNVIEHLNEEIEKRNEDLAKNGAIIRAMEQEMREKDGIIRDQSDTINEYRDEVIKLEESVNGPRYCPVMSFRHDNQMRRRRRRKKRVDFRSQPEENSRGNAQALSDLSDSYSEPDREVSLIRIGLPLTFPEPFNSCNCERDCLFSDSEDEQRSIGLTECSSSACLSSGQRVLESLVTSVMYEMDLCNSLDSGLEMADDDFEEEDATNFNLCPKCTSSMPRDFELTLQDVHHGLTTSAKWLKKMRFVCQRLNNECRELQEEVEGKATELNWSKKMSNELQTKWDQAAEKIQKSEAMEAQMGKMEKQLKEKEEENGAMQSKLNENYVLVAQLSSENLRVMGEKNRLESQIEELGRETEEVRVQLEEELFTTKAKLKELVNKDPEMEDIKEKYKRLEEASRDLETTISILQQQSSQDTISSRLEVHMEELDLCDKSSPDTSSSFDFHPSPSTSLMSSSLNSTTSDFRPRAYSASSHSQGASAKIEEISSPDLGVDMESDPFSSLERQTKGQPGPTYKVGSLALEQILRENRMLKRDREVLTQKLMRSKGALQDTLNRLARSNLHKKEQISPAPVRRSASLVPVTRWTGDARQRTGERGQGWEQQGAKAKGGGVSRPSSTR